MASSIMKVNVTCDSSPFVLFTKLLDCRLKVRERLLDLSDLGFKLLRIESDFGSTRTGELVVRRYPSDGFLHCAATVFAGDFNLALFE